MMFDIHGIESEAMLLGHRPTISLTDYPYGHDYRFAVRCGCGWEDARSSLGRAYAAWLDHGAAMLRDRC